MIRQILILLVALAAMAGSLVAAWATAAARDADLRGYVDATRGPNLPYRLPRLGVNAELTQYAPSELDAQLDRMDAASMAWVRQVFPWDRIEPEPGVFDWTAWDAIVEAVAEHPD